MSILKQYTFSILHVFFINFSLFLFFCLQGKFNVLITTDVAARGIHIKRLKYVLNYDFPSNIEQYCHRVGRTGRDTAVVGTAYSFFPRNMACMAKDLVSLLTNCKQKIEPNLMQLMKDYEGG